MLIKNMDCRRPPFFAQASLHLFLPVVNKKNVYLPVIILLLKRVFCANICLYGCPVLVNWFSSRLSGSEIAENAQKHTQQIKPSNATFLERCQHVACVAFFLKQQKIYQLMLISFNGHASKQNIYQNTFFQLARG